MPVICYLRHFLKNSVINVTHLLWIFLKQFPLHTIFIAVAGKLSPFNDSIVKKTKEDSLAAVRFRRIV